MNKRKNSGLKKIIIMIIVVIMMGVAGVTSLKIYRSEKAKLKEYQTATIPGIICIGDSLTHGTGGENISYPYYLSEDIENDGYFIPVVNLGVGGENTVTIGSRVGAVPFSLEAFTIPSGSEPVEIEILPYNGYDITPLMNDTELNAGINPCVISGVEGVISYEDNVEGESGYYFTRSTDGEEVSVPSGTNADTYASSAYSDGIFIVYMGTNGGYVSTEDLINQYDAIIGLQGANSGKYLIIGMTAYCGNNEEIETAMAEHFGEYFINLREIMCDAETVEKIAAENDIIVTDNDYKSMEDGVVPDCMLDDGIHYIPAGYKLMEETIYERMKALGFFDEISEKTDSFNRWWGLAHLIETKVRR